MSAAKRKPNELVLSIAPVSGFTFQTILIFGGGLTIHSVPLSKIYVNDPADHRSLVSGDDISLVTGLKDRLNDSVFAHIWLPYWIASSEGIQIYTPPTTPEGCESWFC